MQEARCTFWQLQQGRSATFYNHSILAATAGDLNVIVLEEHFTMRPLGVFVSGSVAERSDNDCPD